MEMWQNFMLELSCFKLQSKNKVQYVLKLIDNKNIFIYLFVSTTLEYLLFYTQHN